MSKELIQHIARDNLAAAKPLVESPGIQINFLHLGNSALHWAARKHNYPALELLFTHEKINPNILDKSGRTPLMNAVDSSFIEGVKYLLSATKLLLKESRGFNAYDLAAFNSTHAKTAEEQQVARKIKSLLATPTLLDAAAAGDLALVKRMIEEEGVDVNATNDNGSSALIAATYQDRLEVVEYLLGRPGIQVDAQDSDQFTALNRACERNQVYSHLDRDQGLENKYKIISALIEAGANVNHKTKTHMTPVLNVVGDFTVSESAFRLKAARLLASKDANFRATVPALVPIQGVIQRTVLDLAGKQHSETLTAFLKETLREQGAFFAGMSLPTLPHSAQQAAVSV